MANTTLLSTLLSRMNRKQTIDTVEEQYKVRDLDEAIRTIRRAVQFPWTLKKSTLRVFDGVLEYPVAADHDELAFLDNPNEQNWGSKFRPTYTSVQQFYQDPNNTDDLAEIWDSGTRFLGVRADRIIKGTSQILNNAETAADWTASGDASAVTRDTVFFKEGSASMRFTVTLATNTATMSASNTSISDSNYRKKYFFMHIYLDAVPTSLVLRFGNDSSNYLYSGAITTQFSGQALKADDWNLVAFDLNTASTQGTITSTVFDYQAVVLTGAASGTYYVDASYLREWSLVDYWFYSKYLVATVGNTVANQEYFFNSSEVYSTDSMLIGDSEWVDIIQYEAELGSLSDKENDKVFSKVLKKRDDAWEALFRIYPSMRQSITTTRYNFGTDYTQGYEERLQ